MSPQSGRQPLLMGEEDKRPGPGPAGEMKGGCLSPPSRSRQVSWSLRPRVAVGLSDAVPVPSLLHWQCHLLGLFPEHLLYAGAV